MTFADGFHTILPLAVHITGYRSRPFVPAPSNTVPASRIHVSKGFSLKCDGRGLALQEQFNGCPLLQVSDTIMLHQWPRNHAEAPGYWTDVDTSPAPRTLASCWYLKQRLESGSVINPPAFGIASPGSSPRVQATGPSAIQLFMHTDGGTRYTSIQLLVDEVSPAWLQHQLRRSAPRSHSGEGIQPQQCRGGPPRASASYTARQRESC